MSFLASTRVAVCRAGAAKYPRPPFDPPASYPELDGARLDPQNHVYAAVRDALIRLGLDARNVGSSEWNPLGEFVTPGDVVLLKPNWVSERHHLGGPWEPIITHGAVLRPIIDYVQLALAGRGRIVLADGPMLDSDFAKICANSGVDALNAFYAENKTGCPFELLDLRDILFETRGEVVMRRNELPGDPAGKVAIDLGKASAFYGFPGEGRYYGADYDTSEVNTHHTSGKHEYLLAGTAMRADCIIDVAKLKTHAKVGTTLALKGVVGLNAGRNWLPHHTKGTPDQGGDQFASSSPIKKVERAIVRAFEHASLRFPNTAPSVFRVAKAAGKPLFGRSDRTVRGGGWHGNDTLWRTVLDINRALSYGDPDGALRENTTTKRLVIIDGIIGGDGTGPVFCDPVPAGVIIGGANPVAVDTVATELMGFDFAKVPYLRQAYILTRYPLVLFPPSEVRISSNVEEWEGSIEDLRAVAPFSFAAPNGWRGHLERSPSRRVA